MSSAWECGWHSSSVKFEVPSVPASIFVGYEACDKPSWASSRLENPGAKVSGNPFGRNMQSSGSFVTSCNNYPIHPSAIFNYDKDGPGMSLSLSFDQKGILTRLFVLDLDKPEREGQDVFVFWNPAGGAGQALPERSFQGPSPEMLEELSEALLGQRSHEDCQMLWLLRRPKGPRGLAESLLQEFGNSPTFSIYGEGMADQVAYIIREWSRGPRPWDWINQKPV